MNEYPEQLWTDTFMLKWEPRISTEDILRHQREMTDKPSSDGRAEPLVNMHNSEFYLPCTSIVVVPKQNWTLGTSVQQIGSTLPDCILLKQRHLSLWGKVKLLIESIHQVSKTRKVCRQWLWAGKTLSKRSLAKGGLNLCTGSWSLESWSLESGN